MSVGLRLREERLRLGIGQPAFAALAGATKSALVKWEKDEASPNAKGLIAWAEAGADVLYILTGRRTVDRPYNAAAQIEAQLAGIRRDILEPGRQPLPGEDADQAEKRVMEWHANALSSILQYDSQLIPTEMTDEVAHLLDIVTNPAARALYRAADHVQRRSKRREIKDQLESWFQGGPYEPGAAVEHLLTTIALDYSVPIKFLVELVQEMQEEFLYRLGEGEFAHVEHLKKGNLAP